MLRQYQQMAHDGVLNYLFNNAGNPAVAMPTGTGKSHVIAALCSTFLWTWPDTRIIMLTHVKELVKQNLAKLQESWSDAPIGVYSAGLGRKEPFHPIVYGGVQTVMNSIEKLGRRDIVIIDENHLVSHNADTAYQKIIKHFSEQSRVRTIGFSATQYREGLGMITGNGIFHDVAVDQTTMEWFAYFVAHGYMVPLIPRRTRTEIDLSKVGMSNGDYNLVHLQQAVDVDAITYAALQELCEWGHDRTSWMVFASGVDHAEHVAQALAYFGIPAVTVHSKITGEERDKRIADFKIGAYRCLVVNNIGTIGFDHPPIDLIGMLRPTASTALWVQMLGRGTRPSPMTSKRNCLVLDFARNTVNLGPIDDPYIPKRKGLGTGDPPVWICPACGVYNHAAARFCMACDEKHTFEQKLYSQSSDVELMSSDAPDIRYFNVEQVYYNLHQKNGSRDTIKVTYRCGLRSFNEWICLEHDGFPKHKAHQWWKERHHNEPPQTTAEALQYVRELRKPSRVSVWVNRQYPEVMGAEF